MWSGIANDVTQNGIGIEDAYIHEDFLKASFLKATGTDIRSAFSICVSYFVSHVFFS